LQTGCKPTPWRLLVEHKEDRDDLSKWGNDLRQTYRTVGQAAGVNDVDMHLLMNHSLPGVNACYITRNKLLGDHLRKQQQAISAKIFGTIAKALEEPGALADWLSPKASRRCTGVEAPASRAIAA
jgi:hypothetical protein